MPAVGQTKRHKIDLDRGVMTLRHSETNVYVHMYLDDPGVYYADNGVQIAPELAKLAGFDTARFGKMRERNLKMAAAKSEIDKELSMQNPDEAKVIAEAGEFQVLELPLGNALVVDLEGNHLTPMPVTKEEALKVFEAMTGPLPSPIAAKSK